MKKKGQLIVLEGIDGAGKSTLAYGLYNALHTNHRVLLTKEPGATKFGKQLLNFLNQEDNQRTPESEFLLFAADRAQHLATVVIPALQQGKLVIADRMTDSSVAYQGFGYGLDCAMISTINEWVMKEIKPDLVLYLRLTFEQAHDRIIKRKEKLTSFEKKDPTYWHNVIKGYDTILTNRNNVTILDANLPPDIVQNKALKAISKVL